MNDTFNIIEAVRSLGLPDGEYIVFGSGTLAALGIREVNADVDLLVTPALYEQLEQSGWRNEPKEIEGRMRDRLTHGIFEVYKDQWRGDIEVDVSALIAHPLLIDGVAFLPLDELIAMKRAFGRPKDFKDVELIEEYLRRHDVQV